MQYLLRAYSGILDHECVISESSISKNLELKSKELNNILEYLRKYKNTMGKRSRVLQKRIDNLL